MRICIQPVGDVDNEILKFLKKKLEEIFGMCEILPKVDIPIYAYDFNRNK